MKPSPATGSTVSPVMQDAIACMIDNGGKLYRHPGGFWCKEKMPPRSRYFGTPTISGLRARGLVEYTEWRDGRGGEFPIEVTLKAMMPVEVKNV